MTIAVPPIPTPVPQASDPVNFDDRADAYHEALPGVVAAMNLQNLENNALNNAASASAIASQESASYSAVSAAASAAAAATAAANTQAPKWVSGSTYVEGFVVYSPATRRTYRRKVAGAGTTDPSEDTTNWGATLLDITTNLPKIQPTLNIDFANSQVVDPRITFARASTATRVNKFGLIATVASGVPRIDYDPITLACRGLLIEASRSNLVTYSEQFDNASWAANGATITSNAVAAPDGTVTADKITEGNQNSTHSVQQSTVLEIGVAYALSIYAKAGERTCFRVAGRSSTNWAVFPNALFNLATKTVITSTGDKTATITDAGGGWLRCTAYGTCANGVLGGLIAQTLRDSSDNGTAYTGDGVSGLYIWGAQIEACTSPTSYVPTVASQVTRAADIATIEGANLSSWCNPAQGTLVIDIIKTVSEPLNLFSMGLGTDSANYIGFDYTGTRTSTGNAYWKNGGVSYTLSAPGAGMPDGVGKYAMGYSQGALSVTSQGSIVSAGVPTTPVPALTKLAIGASFGYVPRAQMYFRSVQYYPVKLSDETLQAITLP